MNKIYIWGTGNFGKIIYNALDKAECEILGCIDNSIEKKNTLWNDLMIYPPEYLRQKAYDYVLITTLAYHEIVKACKNLGIMEDKIIVFWNTETRYEFINYPKIILELNDFRISKNKEFSVCINTLSTQIMYLETMVRELPYEMQDNNIKIKSADMLLKELIQNNYSLSRFGDGEFEIMRGNDRAWFQKGSEKLQDRLTEVFYSHNKKMLIAIADNFGSLEKYTDEAAYAIRQYLRGNTRKELVEMIGTERVYYDAYVSRPYYMYKDKNNAKIIFELFKELWRDRNILLVEGEYMRTGIGNDLFNTANKVQRIICPSQNAFDKYDNILNTIFENVHEDDLVLICLGPTATVLAYDVCSKGIQAIDLGQVDNEYEWFLAGVEKRVPILGKAVPELLENSAEECKDKGYVEQIVARIGCLE